MSCTIDKLYFKGTTTKQKIEVEVALTSVRQANLSLTCNGQRINTSFSAEPIDPDKGRYRITASFDVEPDVYMCTFRCNNAEADFGFVATNVEPSNIVVTKVSKFDADWEVHISQYSFMITATQSGRYFVIVTLRTNCDSILAWICTPFDCVATAPVNNQIVFEYRFGPFGGTIGPTIESYRGFYPGGHGNVPSLWGGFPADVMQLEYNYYYINQIRKKLNGASDVVRKIVETVLEQVYEINRLPLQDLYLGVALYHLKQLSKAEETDEYVKYKFFNAEITLYKMPKGCNINVEKVDVSFY